MLNYFRIAVFNKNRFGKFKLLCSLFGSVAVLNIAVINSDYRESFASKQVNIFIDILHGFFNFSLIHVGQKSILNIDYKKRGMQPFRFSGIAVL